MVYRRPVLLRNRMTASGLSGLLPRLSIESYGLSSLFLLCRSLLLIPHLVAEQPHAVRLGVRNRVFTAAIPITHLTRQGRKRCKFASMKAQPIADLYSDYLLASFGATTATGLSQRLEGEVSHAQVTRYLASTKKTAAELGRTVKPLVRQVQSEGGVLIIDDSIEEKPYTEENAIVCWPYDHSTDRVLKGINFLTAV